MKNIGWYRISHGDHSHMFLAANLQDVPQADFEASLVARFSEMHGTPSETTVALVDPSEVTEQDRQEARAGLMVQTDQQLTELLSFGHSLAANFVGTLKFISGETLADLSPEYQSVLGTFLALGDQPQ